MTPSSDASPPCTTKTLSSMRAHSGRRQKHTEKSRAMSPSSLCFTFPFGCQVGGVRCGVREEGKEGGRRGSEKRLSGQRGITSPSKPYILFMFLDSWLPRVRLRALGYTSLYANRVSTTSSEKLPRST